MPALCSPARDSSPFEGANRAWFGSGRSRRARLGSSTLHTDRIRAFGAKRAEMGVFATASGNEGGWRASWTLFELSTLYARFEGTAGLRGKDQA